MRAADKDPRLEYERARLEYEQAMERLRDELKASRLGILLLAFMDRLAMWTRR